MPFTVSERPLIATAEAPPSVGNIATGFDILGHTIEGPRDRVRVRRIAETVVRLGSVQGVVTDLPSDPARNTALRALDALRVARGLDFGFEVDMVKGIPLGSGMGGSAASAVAALVAANALLEVPLRASELYPMALEGEAAASGGRHGDNVGPMLLGGLVLATADRLIRLPVPKDLACVLVHPHLVLETRKAREALVQPYAISDFVSQSAGLAQMMVGLFTGNPDSLRAGLRDVLVEPRREHLIPGFREVKKAAMDEGAIGASISGGGPSVFAWFEGRGAAERSAPTMQRAFGRAGFDSDVFISTVDGPRAMVVG
ncbi:MAG TPA: homoserine kinase [Vicinamibacteria bacterium]|nr:homoserine kinase [Vicinamibacteria bacterium]